MRSTSCDRQRTVANKGLVLDVLKSPVRLTSIKILVISLISVKRKPSSGGRRSIHVILDDEYLIVHRVFQRTLNAYAKWIVFAGLRKVSELRETCQRKRAQIERRGDKYGYLLCVLSRALRVTWCVLKSAVSIREVLDRVETKNKVRGGCTEGANGGTWPRHLR